MTFVYSYSSGNAINTNANLKEAIVFLTTLKEPEKIINGQEGYQAVFLIAKCIGYQTDALNYDLFVDHKMEELYGNVLLYLYTIHSTYDFGKGSIPFSDPTPNADYNERCITIFAMSVYSCNLISSKMFKFKANFQLTNGLVAYLNFLKDEAFVRRNMDLTFNPFNSAKLLVLDYLTLNVSSLSAASQDYKNLWRKLGAMDILLKTSRIKASIREYCYTAILNIADDKEIETCTEIHDFSKALIEYLATAAAEFNAKKFNRQTRQVLNENGVQKMDVHCVKDSNGLLKGLNAVFDAFYNLSINDANKLRIYFDSSAKSSLKTVLLLGNQFERNSCLKLLSQLSFNAKVAEDLSKDTDFLSHFNSMLTSSDIGLKKHCEKIMWNIKENVEKPAIAAQKQVNESQSNSVAPSANLPSHVMISYNTASRELCLKVKEKLEAAGHKVWIDVNDIHGSSLNAMAEAVEKSYVVLICITEKYRQSVNCQAEAQYAFKLNKPIIPLIMQKGYENVSGWLGMIMGDKVDLFNSFCYSFNICNKLISYE